MTVPTKPRLIDSHCHIDMPQFDADREAVLARAHEAGVETMLIVGGVDTEAGHRRALRVAAELGLPCSAGLHPHEAKLATEAVYDELRGLGRGGRIVAVGEIGLDFHYDHSPRPVQREAFRRQVRLAREVGLPVIVHTREADEETAALLEEEGAGEVGGVIHCFTGGQELARRALALGFYISFSGIVAFPRAEGIQAVAKEVPLDRLLLYLKTYRSMAESSFDVVSSVDLQEVKNAIAQAMKEIVTRFDLKGTGSDVTLQGEEIVLSSSDEFKLKAVRDVLEGRLVKRNVPLKALTFGTVEKALGGTARQKVSLQKGIPSEKAREVVKLIKGTKLKVQAAIQGDQVRVSGKNRDDLQAVIRLLKETDLGIDMQFTNYR